MGDTDEETLANVSAADWDFDDPSWDDVSPLAKDFICRLMVKDKRYVSAAAAKSAFEKFHFVFRRL